MNTKRLFERAAGGLEPDVSGIIENIPSLMAEAREARPAGMVSLVIPMARKMIPAMAAAAGLLVLAALFVGYRDAGDTTGRSAGLDALILTGEAGDDVPDILLQVLTEKGEDDG